jgi:predicted dienelactone hydrolase
MRRGVFAKQRRTACALIATVLVAAPLVATSNDLPRPTGERAAGLSTYVWTDDSRDETLMKNASDKREFGVSVWYPAEEGSKQETPYLPDLQLWSLKIGEQRLRETLGSAWDAIRSSLARTHVGVPLGRSQKRFPLLIFLPGLGMNTRVYSSLLADLASHGYVIVAVDPTYEIFATTLGGGRVVGFASPGWFRPPVENIVRYERSRLLVWAGDAPLRTRTTAAATAFRLECGLVQCRGARAFCRRPRRGASLSDRTLREGLPEPRRVCRLPAILRRTGKHVRERACQP